MLALTCFVEIFTQAHYLHSIRDDRELSPLFKDVFYYHWIEEVQHATLDELEWQRVHAGMKPEAIDAAVTDLIELVRMLDLILQAQASADGDYFCSCADAYLDRDRSNAVKACLLKAYRLQYLVSGARIERFQRALSSKVTAGQMQRVDAAFAPLIAYVGPTMSVGLQPDRSIGLKPDLHRLERVLVLRVPQRERLLRAAADHELETVDAGRDRDERGRAVRVAA